jgi:adenylate cyclase
MAPDRVKRKLTAILSADVEGYSRLMGEDEAATVRTITAYRETMSGLIQQYRGRVVDSPGDNLLAEFASVVDAVQCAVEVQQVLKVKNTELPEDRRMQFRIGINLGDVIEEGQRIYGDGVNIAARIEGLAEGGGICISGSAHEQIENKLALGYEYLGEQTVKNISKPIRVYRVPMESRSATEVRKEKRAGLRQWQWTALFLAAVLIMGAGVVAVWNFYLRPSPPPMGVASVEKMAFPLPDKPSIAVLPFTNMSDDPKQEYFSDGITEDIITGLSKIPRLFVIARNSTFTYKSKPVKIQQVGRELGVRYVLEGSVQKSGNRIRITAQLIDASTEQHLWAERYDRDLKDIFALQDEITMKIMTALQVKLTEGEQARLFGKGTANLQAYEKVLQGMEHIRRLNIVGNVQARELFEEAIALDPEYSMAYALLAQTHLLDVWLGLSKSPDKSIEKAVELAQKALALDDTLAFTHTLWSHIYRLKRQHKKAIAEGERAIALNPNGADAHAYFAPILFSADKPVEALAMIKKAIRLNPFPPNIYFQYLGSAYRMTGQYEEAIVAFKKALIGEPDNLFAHFGLVVTYSLLGRDGKARAEAAELLRIAPNFSLDHISKTFPSKNRVGLERTIDVLRKAGLK